MRRLRPATNNADARKSPPYRASDPPQIRTEAAMLNGENSYECRLLRSADDVGLALHIWRTHRARGSLFYIHGIQSHGGWLFETGPQLAQRGIQVFALDRRGSGRSEG